MILAEIIGNYLKNVKVQFKINGSDTLITDIVKDVFQFEDEYVLECVKHQVYIKPLDSFESTESNLYSTSAIGYKKCI